MAHSQRVVNKRALKSLIAELGRVSDRLAEIAQEYNDERYEKYNKVFKLVFTQLEIAKDLLTKLEAWI